MFSWLKTKSGAPNARTVLERTIILRELFVKGLVTPPLDVLAKTMDGWGETERHAFNEDGKKQFSDRISRLRELGLWIKMMKEEREFLNVGPLETSRQAMVDAIWLIESIVCLLWALGYVSELPPYDEQTDPEMANRLPKESAETLFSKVSLRPAHQIQKQRDIAELWHWRSRTRRLQELGQMPPLPGEGYTIEEIISLASSKAAEAGDLPAPIEKDFPAFGKAYRDISPEEFATATSIAQERHRAFNWLCGLAPGNRWADTPTDT